MNPLPSADKVFAAAIALTDLSARSAYLERACGGNLTLRHEVESLLTAAERAGTFLESPAPGAVEVLREAQDASGSPLTEKAGNHIGRYKLLERIGEGGFGVVWMAEQEEPVRRRVALKIIKLGMDTREVVARFEAERQALAMMDHPNIASVFDGGATDTGRPYFVMELVKGIPITDYCDANKLPTRERLELFIQVCNAVQHAHQKGVIHRDLKPSNILVTVKDDRPVPKVIDFGIAKATQSRLTEKTLFTCFNQWVGTPAYMSPEQAGLGSLDVDTRSDVYALGVLLYELLTGRPPFDTKKLLASGYDAVMRTIREEEPPKPSTRLSTLNDDELTAVATKRGAEPANLGRLVRGDLDWVVMKAMEKDRTRRYETASGLARDIQRHLGDEPVQARPPSNLYRLQKTVHRNKLLFATGGLVGASLVLGLGISTILLFKEKAARERAVAAEQQADEARAQEARQREEATAKAHESLERLVRLQNANGIALMAEDDLASSLPWFAEALNLQQGQPEREEMQRIRISSVLQECPKTVQMWFHGGPVTSAHFSRNGRLVVTASRDHTARLWDASTGKPVGSVLQHTGIVWHAVFSPESRRVATASEDGTARVWDADTGQPVTRPLRHRGPVVNVAFSPNGKMVATASEDHTVQLCDAESGEVIATLADHGDAVRQLAFSPDNRLLATGGDDSKVRIWQTSATDVSPTVFLYSGPLTALQFNDAGNFLLTSSLDGSARTFIVMQNHPYLHPTINHIGPVLHSAFSPNGRYLVTACGAGSARIHEVLSGQPTSPELLHRGAVYWANFDAEGRRVVTASADHTAGVWEAGTGELTARLRHGGAVRMAEFGPDNRFLLTAGDDGTARIWNLPEAAPLYRRAQDEPPLWHSTAGPNGTTRVVRDQRQTEVASIGGAIPGGSRDPRIQHAATIRAAVFSPDGRQLATASDDQTARVWSVGTGQPVSPPLEHRAPVWRVAFSPNGRLLATATAGRTIRVWDAATGEPITPHLRHTGPITNLVFSPDGGSLLASGEGGPPQIWTLTPTELSTQDLSGLAELLAGRRLDDTKTSLEPCSAVSLSNLWESVGKKYLSGFIASDAARRPVAEPSRTPQEPASTQGPSAKDAAKASGPAQPASASVPIPDRDPRADRNQLDLTRFYNAALTQGWQTPEEEALTGNDLSEVPRGLVELGGIRFDVRGIVQVSGQAMKAQGGRYPEQIKGIPVNRKCARVHFLHSTGWSTDDGTEIGAYVIHYADGQRRVLPIIYGEDVRDWFFFESLPVASSHARVAWLGANPRTRANGSARLQLYLRTWENPTLEVEIRSIDFVSAMTACAPFLIGITFDDLASGLEEQSAKIEKLRQEEKTRAVNRAIEQATLQGNYQEALRLVEDRLNTERARLGATNTQTLQTLRGLVDLSGRVGDWAGCVGHARTLMELSGYDPLVARGCAVAALLAGDERTYREVCVRMIAEHGTTADPVTAERTAKVCLLAPDALADPTPALRLAKLTVNSRETDLWFRLVQGMAEFRSGHPEAAIQWLEPVLSGDELHAATLAGYFTSMAQHRLNAAEQARTTLAGANGRLDAFLQPGFLTGSGWDQWWFDAAASLTLRIEAERTVLGRPVSPPLTLASLAAARKAWCARQLQAPDPSLLTGRSLDKPTDVPPTVTPGSSGPDPEPQTGLQSASPGEGPNTESEALRRNLKDQDLELRRASNTVVSPAEVGAFMQSFQQDPNASFKISTNPNRVPLLLAAIGREPAGPWVHYLQGFCFGSEHASAQRLPSAQRPEIYAQGIRYLTAAKETVSKASRASSQDRKLKDNLGTLEAGLALAYVESGTRNKEARAIAETLLAANTVTNWNYGNLIYAMHSLLGRIALREGDLAAAKRHLAESGKTPGSPQLNSFGPDLVLAGELLQRGERDAVLQHLDQIAVFWANTEDNSRLAQDHQKKIETWKLMIRAGRIPDDHQWQVAGLSLVDSEPTDQTAVRNARRQICVNQLKQIEMAKQSWAVDKDKPKDAAPTVADLAGYLPGGKFPKCLDGGTYVIGKVNQDPRCSVAGHELPKRPD